MVLALITMCLIFLGGGLASDVLGKIGLGDNRSDDLALRALARGAGRDDDDLRDRLLRRAERRGAAFPLDLGGCGRGGRAVDPGVRAVLRLRLELLVVFGDLRGVRGGGDPDRVAVGHEPRAAVRSGVERRDRPQAVPALSETYDGPVLPAKEPAEA